MHVSRSAPLPHYINLTDSNNNNNRSRSSMCSALAISPSWSSSSSRRCRIPQQQLIIRASLKVKGLFPELLTTVAPAPGAISFISPNDDHGFPCLQSGTSAQAKVYQVVLKQASMEATSLSSSSKIHGSSRRFFSPHLLDEAYRRCGEICAEYAKTFYLGTLLMTPERRKAIWAIYGNHLKTQYAYFRQHYSNMHMVMLNNANGKRIGACKFRRTDELVDGPNSCYITARALEAWERRLEDAFDGRPYDMLDAALSHTVAKFPMDIQPFRDMIEGMRTDLKKWRYVNFEELYLYCYYVAGTVGLMSVPVMGMGMSTTQLTTISLHHLHHHVYGAALALGVANQLTNILRDVGEDARRGRIYLPQDELHEYGLTDQDILKGEVTGKWVMFMKAQITRARKYFDQAEKGISSLDKASRWPVWCSLILYRQILDAIELNGYNNFTKRACVGKVQKIVTLPVAYMRSLVPHKWLSCN